MSILSVERKGGALILTLNRPQASNAISSELAAELLSAVLAADADPAIRSIVVTGAGDKAFCAGADLKQRRTMTPDEKWGQSRALWRVNQALWDSPKATIAAIGGWCLGGGFELALYCDLRIAAEDAQFGWPEMSLGAYPGAGGAVMLPRIVGRAKAKEMFFTAGRIGAKEALELGLVECLAPRAQLLDQALAIARRIEGTSPLGLAAVKRVVNQGADLSMEAAAALDQSLRKPLEATHDYAEGIQAHFEKRKPVFIGR